MYAITVRSFCILIAVTQWLFNNAAYTAILESYGIDNNNEDSDQEAQQREEFHPVSPMKSLELTKNWHAEFQSLLKLEDSAQKYMQLSRLARDFVYASKLYAKVCIYTTTKSNPYLIILITITRL